MCGPSVKGWLALLLALFTATEAQAKTWNFDTASPFGLGFLAGVSQNPDSDLIAKPYEASTKFSHFFGFEPFLDFGNFVIRLSGQLHSYPVLSGSSSDSQGSFSQTSDASSAVFGAHLLLSPYIAENKTRRGFIRLGFSQGIVQGENVRTYASGTRRSEKFEGRTRELLIGAGLEFFLVQNYSLQLESGYRQSEYEKLESDGGTDLAGASLQKGAALTNASGTNRKLNASGPYLSLGLNLHF